MAYPSLLKTAVPCRVEVRHDLHRLALNAMDDDIGQSGHRKIPATAAAPAAAAPWLA